MPRLQLKILEKLRAGNDKEQDRIDAAAQLVSLRKTDPDTVSDLFKLISPRTSPEFNNGILEAIRQSESRDGGTALVSGLKSLPPSSHNVAIAVLLEKTDWTEALVAGLESGKVQLSDLSLDQKQALLAHPKKEIAERAKKLLASGGGCPTPIVKK